MPSLFDELLKSAKAGNLDAQMKVAEIYFKGIGVIPNTPEAIKWLYIASEKNKFAPSEIEKMYREGLGVKKDIHKAFLVAKEFAEKGNEIQMFDLAGYYLNGMGTDKDVLEAIKWYELAFENGFNEAAYILGYVYQTNEEIKDFDKAIEWYKKSADKNNPRACYNLGYIYYDGTKAIKNNEKALEYLNKALKLGLKEAKPLIDEINADGGYHSYSIYI